MRIRSLVVLAVSALTLALAGTAQADPSADVIGGTDVSHSDYTTSYPYMVGLTAAQNPNTQFCGGTLIAPTWVMTAAHCYAPEEGAAPNFIRIGSEDRLVGGQYVPVTGHFIHPGWDPDLISNDIMLLKLANAPTPAIPAVRATAIDYPAAGNLATLIGWGLTMPGEDGVSSRMLKLATLDVVNQSVCEANWEDLEGFDFVSSNQVCAIHYDTGSGARSGCNGDSGGPLLYGSKVIGIVSFGYLECWDEAPNVFTRVSAYNGWIDSIRAKTLSASSDSLSFGALDVTNGTVSQTIRMRSEGDSAINITGVGTSGDFTVKSNTCGGLLASQADCFVEVAFDPTATGSRVGVLSISSDAAATPVTRVSLNGVGTGAVRAPIKLKFSMPHKPKVKGKILTAKFNVGFVPPFGSNPPGACGGLVRLSMKVPKLKKTVFKTGSMLWKINGCSVTLTARMPKKVKGKTAKATVTFAGNNDVAKTTVVKSIKLR